MSCLPRPFGIGLPVDTRQRPRAREPELVVAGDGVDDVGTVVSACEVCSAYRRRLAKGHGEPEGDERE